MSESASVLYTTEEYEESEVSSLSEPSTEVRVQPEKHRRGACDRKVEVPLLKSSKSVSVTEPRAAQGPYSSRYDDRHGNSTAAYSKLQSSYASKNGKSTGVAKRSASCCAAKSQVPAAESVHLELSEESYEYVSSTSASARGQSVTDSAISSSTSVTSGLFSQRAVPTKRRNGCCAGGESARGEVVEDRVISSDSVTTSRSSLHSGLSQRVSTLHKSSKSTVRSREGGSIEESSKNVSTVNKKKNNRRCCASEAKHEEQHEFILEPQPGSFINSAVTSTKTLPGDLGSYVSEEVIQRSAEVRAREEGGKFAEGISMSYETEESTCSDQSFSSVSPTKSEIQKTKQNGRRCCAANVRNSIGDRSTEKSVANSAKTPAKSSSSSVSSSVAPTSTTIVERSHPRRSCCSKPRVVSESESRSDYYSSKQTEGTGKSVGLYDSSEGSLSRALEVAAQSAVKKHRAEKGGTKRSVMTSAQTDGTMNSVISTKIEGRDGKVISQYVDARRGTIKTKMKDGSRELEVLSDIRKKSADETRKFRGSPPRRVRRYGKTVAKTVPHHRTASKPKTYPNTNENLELFTKVPSRRKADPEYKVIERKVKV